MALERLLKDVKAVFAVVFYAPLSGIRKACRLVMPRQIPPRSSEVHASIVFSCACCGSIDVWWPGRCYCSRWKASGASHCLVVCVDDDAIAAGACGYLPPALPPTWEVLSCRVCSSMANPSLCPLPRTLRPLHSTGCHTFRQQLAGQCKSVLGW